MLTSDNGSNASMAAGQVSHKLPTSLSQLLQTAPRAGRERTGSREAGSAPAASLARHATQAPRIQKNDHSWLKKWSLFCRAVREKGGTVAVERMIKKKIFCLSSQDETKAAMQD
jgi:hypothetical protein